MTPPKATPNSRPGTAGVGRPWGRGEGLGHSVRGCHTCAASSPAAGRPAGRTGPPVQVVLHHVLEAQSLRWWEVVYPGLQGKAHHAAAGGMPSASSCAMRPGHHALALLHLGEGAWHRQSGGQGRLGLWSLPISSLTPPETLRGQTVASLAQLASSWTPDPWSMGCPPNPHVQHVLSQTYHLPSKPEATPAAHT